MTAHTFYLISLPPRICYLEVQCLPKAFPLQRSFCFRGCHAAEATIIALVLATHAGRVLAEREVPAPRHTPAQVGRQHLLAHGTLSPAPAALSCAICLGSGLLVED